MSGPLALRPGAEHTSAAIPCLQRQPVERNGSCGALRHSGARRGWGLDRGVSVHSRLREPGGYARRSSCQHTGSHSALSGGARGTGQVVSRPIPSVYLDQAQPREGLEATWERNTCLSTLKISPWPSVSNWPRICGIASTRRVRRSHSHLPRRLSLMSGCSSCDAVRSRVSHGRPSATVSTVVCGDRSDDSGFRSTGRRSGHRRGGGLVRESRGGSGQRVPSVGGNHHRLYSTNARCLSQDTRGRSPSPTSTLSVCTLLLAGAFGYTCHRLPTCPARPRSVAASDRGRDTRLTRLARDRFDRSPSPARAHRGGA